MTGNVFLSFGSLFFSILLTIVYFIKAKQTTVNNKIFKTLLITLNLTVLSEIIAIIVIYNHSNNTFIENLVCRINMIFTISWAINIACYILTLGNTNKITNYKDKILNSKDLKLLICIYIISVVISLFIHFDNFSNSEGAYISGPAIYFMYIIGGIAILSSIIKVMKNNRKLPHITAPIIIGIVISISTMILQIIFPMYLMLTCMFVFNTYILYFTFENPDLYLIREFELAKKKAEISNKTKTDFLSNMSHEIRTPMNAIIGFSDSILTEEKFDAESAKKDISNIYSAGNNLLEIINNILDISKIETGEEKVENKEYNLVNIILELKTIIDSRILSKKVKFITEIDPKIPKVLIGDRTKLFQILLNILSNSVKYTEVGIIKLKITSEIIDDKVMLHFDITDTGYGIKKQDYDKLFEKFSRLDTATEKEIEGTGLGLVITKRLVDLIGGKIWFESEYGAGTSFYIDLIQNISDSSEIGDVFVEENKKQKNKYLDCSKYKILIVDDNKLNLKVAEKILLNYKFQITTFDNGKDCITDIKKGTVYDLIFLDHMMPEMDGIEVLKILKKLEDYKIPPIIVLTANAIAGMKEMYLNEGFDEYLSKPINTTDLDKIINKYFRKDNETEE